MKNLDVLFAALHYVETHLTEPFAQEEVAAACHFSLSGVHKLFRYALHMSLKDYVTKRRVTAAARDLTHGASVTETAMRYQYNSSEVFTRAFAKEWGATPSAFKSERRFTGLFPPITDILLTMEGKQMTRQLDISELYDTLKGNIGNYVLYFDIKNLIGINEISRRLGDAAIRESLARIEAAATESMLLFRIGGDEFALVTDTADREAACAIAERVVGRNGAPVSLEDMSTPLSLWAGGSRLVTDNLRYQEVFDALQSNISSMKDTGKDINILD